MNILISSAGRRIKLIEYFKREFNKLGGKVVAVDCDPMAPALGHADCFEVVPRIGDPEYMSHISDICAAYEIRGVLSLIDPELSFLAEKKKDFLLKNIMPLVSDKAVIDICFDKYLTYQFLKNSGLPVVPTFLQIEEVINAINTGQLKFPLIIKPKNGSASIGIQKVHSIQELIAVSNKEHEFIIQPFIEGAEIGVDCYIDFLSEEVTHIFCKKKVTMRAGETDRSISIKDSVLMEMIEQLVITLKLLGPIDIDCFKTTQGYMISEINPRFGGGYLHAHEAGQNFVSNIINNLQGRANLPNLNNYESGTTMVKFDNVMLLSRGC